MNVLGLSVALFLLGQIGRLSINQQEINLYLYEIPFFIWLTYQLYFRREILKLRKETYVFLGIMLLAFLFGIASVSVFPNIVSFLYLLRLSGYLLGFDLVVKSVAKGNVSKKFIQSALILLGFVGVVQYFLYSNLRNLQYLGWDPHQYRVFGLFFDTSVAGAVYGLILTFLIYEKHMFKPMLKKWIYAICYMMLGLLTYSRGFLISIFSASAIGSLIVARNIKLLAFAVVLILGFIVLAPTPFGEGVKLLRTSTIESRLVDYQQGLSIFEKNPVLGIGYNRIRYFRTADSVVGRGLSHAGASFHSSYLTIMVTSGVLGFSAFILWLFGVSRLSSFALISTVFLGVYSLFDNILLHPFILFLWPILIGLTFRKKP